MTFFAHHSGMLQSSVAELGIVPYLVFQWLLERCDEDGIVCDARPRVIARDLTVLHESLFTLEAVEDALSVLQQPDPSSKRTDHQGRRIVPNNAMGSSFVVVTYLYYNEEWALERQRKKAAKRQRRQRAKNKSKGSAVTQASRSVTARHAAVTHRNGDVTPSNAVSIDPERNTEPNAATSSERDEGVAVVLLALERVAGHLAPFEEQEVSEWITAHAGDAWSLAALLLEKEGRFTGAYSKEYLRVTIQNAHATGVEPEDARGYVQHRLRGSAPASFASLTSPSA